MLRQSWKVDHMKCNPALCIGFRPYCYYVPRPYRLKIWASNFKYRKSYKPPKVNQRRHDGQCEIWIFLASNFNRNVQERSFVETAEATSVGGSRECDTPQESAWPELSDDTKVKWAFLVRIPTCLCVMIISFPILTHVVPLRFPVPLCRRQWKIWNDITFAIFEVTAGVTMTLFFTLLQIPVAYSRPVLNSLMTVKIN